MFRFEKLDVWAKSVDFAGAIYFYNAMSLDSQEFRQFAIDSRIV